MCCSSSEAQASSRSPRGSPSSSRSPVPITGQTFAVLLVGASFGALLGLASLGLYIFVGALGAPICTPTGGTAGTCSPAPGGYLVGFAIAAFVIGTLAQRRWDRRFPRPSRPCLPGASSSTCAASRGWPRRSTPASRRRSAGPLPVRRRRPSQAVSRRCSPPERVRLVERARGRR